MGMWIGLLGLALLPWLQVRVMLGSSLSHSSSVLLVALDLFWGALCVFSASQLLGAFKWDMRYDRQKDQKRRLSLITSHPRASGLMWREIEKEPIGGHLLENEELAEALMRKKLKQSRYLYQCTEISEQEWHAIGIKDLRKEHYVKSGGSYFIPAQKCLCGSGKLFDLCHNPYYIQRIRSGEKQAPRPRLFRVASA